VSALFNLILLQSEYYHLIDVIAYFIAAAVPTYFLIKSRNSVNNPLRKVMIILAGFVIAQGVYHVAGMLGLHLLSKVVLEPLSAAVLVLVAVAYFLTRTRILRQQQKEVNSPVGK
jgi:NO-binding membrane sensor protein with MHYT domain